MEEAPKGQRGRNGHAPNASDEPTTGNKALLSSPPEKLLHYERGIDTAPEAVSPINGDRT